MAKPQDDLDKMLADTLAGVRAPKKKEAPAPAAPPPPPPPAPKPVEAKPRTQPGGPSLDKKFQDTLSGLEKTVRRTAPGTTPVPQVPTPPPAAPPRPAPAPLPDETVRVAIPVAERMPIAQPVFPAAAPAPAHVEDEEPKDGTRFGQYVLLEKIATGGMAEVWKARMRGVEGFQKIVAIKKILPHLSDNQDFIEMFVDEAKLAAQLNHNNIIHIYDLGKIQNSYYIAMEYIDGYDLKNILSKAQERDQPLSVEIAVFVASKIAAALDYAHRKRDFEDKEMGLVHRDVSPQNVLISQEGDIKLCDFGIAKAASKASHTQAGALKGKLQYMSPEQAWGRNIDRRSDIFALAAVLFEMLTARKLFSGDNELSILEQVREARVTLPSQYNDEVTPEIDAIVAKALKKDPTDRYQTAGEMQRDLDAVLYSFRPTPTSADLAIYMHRLATSAPVAHSHPHAVEEHHHAPEPAANELRPMRTVAVPAPAVAAAAAAAPAAAPLAYEPMHVPPVAAAPATAVAEPPAKKLPVVPIAIAAVAILAVGGFLLMRGGSKTAAPAKAAVPVATASAPAQTVPAAPPASTTTAAAVAPGTVAPTSTAAAIDPSKVNEEVQKRLAAERARLDQLARAQNQPAAAAPAPAESRPAPQPQVAAAQPQPVAPPPVENRPAPAPQPVAPAPQPVAESRPAPQQEAPRTQAGELVPPGTPGLTPAHITQRASAVYPPIARNQHVQGTVIITALISEAGQVLQTKIIKGGPFGLSEAAEQSVRRSTFAPGEKDGVRVKSWTTVEVNFKL